MGRLGLDDDNGRDLVFEIHSVARSADRAFNALYSYLPAARKMQLYMWVHFLLSRRRDGGGHSRRQARGTHGALPKLTIRIRCPSSPPARVG
jgi:hypothetical protein